MKNFHRVYKQNETGEDRSSVLCQTTIKNLEESGVCWGGAVGAWGGMLFPAFLKS